MENPFGKLKPSILGNILGRCDVADIARMRCTDRALASLLRTRATRKMIYEWKQKNNEYGYSLVIFQAQNSDEISVQRAVRAREVHVVTAGNGVVMLENGVVPRRRLVVYEGRREGFNLAELWHQDSKFSANESSVLSFIAAGDGPYNFMVMKTEEPEWKWTEHEKCRFTHPSLNFSFIIEGDKFMKITSLLPQLPLPLRFANSIRMRLPYMVATELVDVNSRRQINQSSPISWEIRHVLPHVAFELKHVFEWGDGIVYIVFLGDKNVGHVDLGARTIEDMHPGRLQFEVSYWHKLTGPIRYDDNNNNDCRKKSQWLTNFLLRYIYSTSTSFLYDKVQLISSHNRDLYIIRREKTGKLILVELWLDGENMWGYPVRLIPHDAGYAWHVGSFCVWQLGAQHFGIDSVLVLAKLRDIEAGAWWILQRLGRSASVVSHGILQGINDGTRFSLVRHLQSN